MRPRLRPCGSVAIRHSVAGERQADEVLIRAGCRPVHEPFSCRSPLGEDSLRYASHRCPWVKMVTICPYPAAANAGVMPVMVTVATGATTVAKLEMPLEVGPAKFATT